MVMSEEVCPICLGSGDDPGGCGCRCSTEEETAACTFPGCMYCNCAGCGGTCCYCGGTGKEKDWQEGGPYERQKGRV